MKINWIGCKKKLLPQIIAHLPSQFKTYYEPFLGSGVVYLSLKPKKAILNDCDNNLMNLWHIIFFYPKQLVSMVVQYENKLYATDNQQKQKALFKAFLEKFNHCPTLTMVEKSTLFFLLIKYCFRGIIRYTRKGLYCSFGYKKRSQKPLITLEELKKHTQIFQNTTLLCQSDYQNIINQANKDDFLFIDPPYYYEKGKDKEFYQTPFTFEDHKLLAKTLHQATKRGVKWLYTNYDTKQIFNLFSKYNIIKTKTTTTHNLTNRHIKQELIIKNY